MEFHAAGADHRERLLMAANQVGKSYSGAGETAIHLTGRYPDWWEGRRWDRPVRFWAASETWEVTRDAVQRLLIGPPADREAWGEGLIPAEDLIGDPDMKPGVPNCIDTIRVRHQAGGVSTLGFKAYEQGRRKFQAETLDGVWFDEEPKEEIYDEGLTRTNATNGITYLTFTPLLGVSRVVKRFLSDADAKTMTQST